jgi:filamentous hemagglutinin family protein
MGAMLFAMLTLATVCLAGTVTLDGTVGPSGPLTGPNYNIPATLGKTVGNNLFQSFSQFNLAQGDVATFSGPGNIQNVISRVTGGSASTIDGTINCTIAGANFFLINPFGVMFGPDASVNVSGAFTATTASYVKLADGGRFDAANPANDMLTAAPVSAFGFLNSSPGAITVNQSMLTMPNQLGFSLIGGDITLDGVAGGVINIEAPGGRINLVSIKSPGELTLDVTDPSATVDTSGFATLGAVTFVNGAIADVSSDAAGTVGPGKLVINADSLSMDPNSALGADNQSAENGVGIEVDVRSAIDLNGAYFSAVDVESGNGSSINMNASSITLQNSANISTLTLLNDASSTGNAGNITIKTDSLNLKNSFISVQTSTTGAAGNLTINANSISLASSSLFGLSNGGPAGNVVINTDSLQLVADGAIQNQTAGASAGGNISVTASSITMDGKGQIAFTGISVQALNNNGPATGPGGDIVIHAGTISLQNGAEVLASSQTTGDAGNINIQARDLTLDTEASIASSATSSGNAGGIALSVSGLLLIENDADLSVSSAQSDGGNIDVTGGLNSRIQLNDGLISAQAEGNGGNVTITTPGSVSLFDSQISAASVNGDGGNITLDPSVVVLDKSQISANAIVGNGGNISIVSDYFLETLSKITASSQFGLQGSV